MTGVIDLEKKNKSFSKISIDIIFLLSGLIYLFVVNYVSAHSSVSGGKLEIAILSLVVNGIVLLVINIIYKIIIKFISKTEREKLNAENLKYLFQIYVSFIFILITCVNTIVSTTAIVHGVKLVMLLIFFLINILILKKNKVRNRLSVISVVMDIILYILIFWFE